jgi:anthranilate phosphoribosyltransferase
MSTPGAGSGAIQAALAQVIEGTDLTREQARDVMADVMGGMATSAQVAAFLVALRMKGETAEEIAGAAEAMRAAALTVESARRPVVDTCGTGGDGKGTLNLSTAAALVAAGGGVVVAKHGNRAVSSRAGSADVLEALGVRLDLDPHQLGACLDDVGIAFLFAPVLHPAMRHAIGPRREIRIRTLFNILGPLTNPARAERQVLGVFAARLAPTIAEVLRQLGSEHALVVHGPFGVDELLPAPGNLAVEIRSGWPDMRSLEVDPAALGFASLDESDLAGGDPAANAGWIVELLEGRAGGPARDAVVLNAAAVFYVAGLAADLAEGCARAQESLDSGRARATLERLRSVSQKL